MLAAQTQSQVYNQNMLPRNFYKAQAALDSSNYNQEYYSDPDAIQKLINH